MWIPKPDPYEWKPWEVDHDGIPFVKGSAVVLDRINEHGVGERERFSGQDAVDEAWATGWHDTGRPETADVIWEDEEEKEEEEVSKPKPKSYKSMNKAEKIEYGETLGLELHDDMSHEEMNLDIKSALIKLEGEEEGE